MPDTLTLTRFEPRLAYSGEVDRGTRRIGAFVDVETTGLDPDRDEIIQLAITRFTYSDDGQLGTIGVPFVEYDQPSEPIPEEITRLTGITDDMVRGQRIDTARVIRMMTNTNLVVAHNANFDRPFTEKRIPAFRSLPWACSHQDIPWREAGYGLTKLEWLLFKHCQMFYDAHTADIDCAVGIHLLSTEVLGRRALSYLIDAAKAEHFRVWAIDAPFEVKETLKANGYFWNPGTNGLPKAWYRDVAGDAAAHEQLAWLKDERLCYRPQVLPFDALTRFTTRIAQ